MVGFLFAMTKRNISNRKSFKFGVLIIEFGKNSTADLWRNGFSLSCLGAFTASSGCPHSSTWDSWSTAQLTFLPLLYITFSHKHFLPPRLIFSMIYILLHNFSPFLMLLLSCKHLWLSPNTYSTAPGFYFLQKPFPLLFFFSCPKCLL